MIKTAKQVFDIFYFLFSNMTLKLLNRPYFSFLPFSFLTQFCHCNFSHFLPTLSLPGLFSFRFPYVHSHSTFSLFSISIFSFSLSAFSLHLPTIFSINFSHLVLCMFLYFLYFRSLFYHSTSSLCFFRFLPPLSHFISFQFPCMIYKISSNLPNMFLIVRCFKQSKNKTK